MCALQAPNAPALDPPRCALYFSRMALRDGSMRRFIDAARFAAVRHRDQKRKGMYGAPYINHLLEVAQLLALEGIDDEDVLIAALLHDAVEDVGVTFQELEDRFGPRVTSLVRELTDDMRLNSRVRKQLEVAHAPTMSADAQAIKVADKLSNVRAVYTSPPEGWGRERKRAYCDFARALVQSCSLAPEGLVARFEQTYEETMRQLAMDAPDEV